MTNLSHWPISGKQRISLVVKVMAECGLVILANAVHIFRGDMSDKLNEIVAVN